MKYVPLLPYWKPETVKGIIELFQKFEETVQGENTYYVVMASTMLIAAAIQSMKHFPPNYGGSLNEAKLQALREVDKALNFMFDGWVENEEEEVLNNKPPSKKEWIN